jgi:hypothetical protein
MSRKRSADEMDVDDSFSEAAVRDVYNEYFFPRFLTSRELLELEVSMNEGGGCLTGSLTFKRIVAG